MQTSNTSPFSSFSITSCDSFNWDGLTYDSTGLYTNVYTDVNGCDSTVTLDLTINNSSSSTVTITACDSIDWDGLMYYSTGLYTNLYPGLNGCDSTVTLDLTIIIHHHQQLQLQPVILLTGMELLMILRDYILIYTQV